MALVAALLTGAVAAAVEVPVPALLGPMSFSLPLVLLLPLVPVCLVIHGQGRGDTASEVVAVRSLARWDTTTMLLLAVSAISLGVVESQFYDFPLGIAMGRNFVGYLGLALLIRGLAGPAVATSLVCVVPFFCTSFGVAGWGRPRFWAWPLHESGSVIAFVAALILLAAGLAVAARSGPGPRRTALA
ncbi:hypothetical protein [Streptomyces sp. NPDC094049]|uniref:hypothetical protein n=1 Tax=Streptomyces sp. NPDC094049 TaxID=3154987 RepID=UPI00332D742B